MTVLRLSADAAIDLIAPPSALRDKVERLESELRKFPQLQIEPEHTFGPGFYARTLKLPAGTVLTGKVHKTEHIFMVTRGDITVVTDDGVRTVSAGHQAVCRPGMKRAGICHTEVWCTNVHITSETDLDKLEALLVFADALEAPSVQELLQ
jgi:quercetin dioxygenase-like cupin family protein